MKVVIGQGSCGVATGARKTAAEFEKQIAEKNLDVKIDITGCVGTCYLEPIVDVYEDSGKMTRYVKVQPETLQKSLTVILQAANLLKMLKSAMRTRNL